MNEENQKMVTDTFVERSKRIPTHIPAPCKLNEKGVHKYIFHHLTSTACPVERSMVHVIGSFLMACEYCGDIKQYNFGAEGKPAPTMNIVQPVQETPPEKGPFG